MAQRVQDKIKLVRVAHGYSQAADYVTLSMGVASIIPNDDQTQLDLINSADELLYAAKRNGRNQIKSPFPFSLS